MECGHDVTAAVEAAAARLHGQLRPDVAWSEVCPSTKRELREFLTPVVAAALAPGDPLEALYALDSGGDGS